MSVPSTPPSHAMMFFGSTMPEIYLDQIDPTSVALTQNMELSVEQTSSLLKYALLKVERENIEKVPSPAHKFCRHRGACSASAWRGFLKGATVGLGVKCSMSVLSALIFGKIFRKCQIFRPRAVLRTIVSLDMARFGAFTALFLGGFRGCQCILRRVRRKDDRWNAFVAGWVAGLAIICDVRHRRKSLSIFMLVRSIAFGVQLLVANGRLPKVPHVVPLLFSLGSMEVMYAWAMHPESISTSFHRWISHKGGIDARMVRGVRANVLSENPKEFLDEWCRLHKIPELPSVHQKLLPCEVLHPRTSLCTVNVLKQIPYSFLACLPVYIPVHALPLILFRFKALRMSPLSTLLRLAKSILRSTCFMAAFPVIYWGVFCAMRNILQHDSKLTFLISGFMSGNSIFIEKASRREELMLFVLPKMIESGWVIMKKHGWKRNSAVNPIMFCVSAAIMMTLYQHHPDAITQTYYWPMRKVFGVQ
eukprot:222091_1